MITYILNGDLNLALGTGMYCLQLIAINFCLFSNELIAIINYQHLEIN